MNRIGKAYETKFRTVLGQLRARKMDQGVNWLMTRARYLSQREGITPAHALAEVHGRLLETKRSFLRDHPRENGDNATHGSVTKAFLCDAGLGGLARWLRASGYEAIWIPDIDDDDLLREGVRLDAIILTTDSMLMERRVLRDGIIPAVWVPPTLTMLEQLALIFQELDLEMRDSRCMSCGGEMIEIDKEAVRDRIPPRTLKWLNEFFECRQCGKLFWHGTHWQRITSRLKAV
ncbi:MAG: hypothetical protein JWQ71_2998 [Pedosphaera sp.]|nr:hypothetical protein [Pedosphaera sp.]